MINAAASNIVLPEGVGLFLRPDQNSDQSIRMRVIVIMPLGNNLATYNRAVASGPVGPVFTGPLFSIKKRRRGIFNNFYQWPLQFLSVAHQPHQPLTLFYILSVALE